MAKIHSTALVEKGAKLGSNVVIGPYCIISAGTTLHDNVELKSHVVTANNVEVGADSTIYSFVSLGAPGQIYQRKGEIGRLVVGARSEIREHVTMNCGSPRANMLTKVGDDCMFMIGAHVAHDCMVGNKVIFANNATLGGHVSVGDHVFLGGLSAVHQFCAIGEHAIIGGMTGVFGHVIPFGHAIGDRARLVGLNLVGMERRGFSKKTIQMLNHAFQFLFQGGGVFSERLSRVENVYPGTPEVARVANFIRSVDKRRPLTFADAPVDGD